MLIYLNVSVTKGGSLGHLGRAAWETIAQYYAVKVPAQNLLVKSSQSSLYI